MKRKLPAIFMVLIVFSCSPHEESMHDTERWTSSDPLAIPLRVREQKFKQGNLVYNPSFELGKVLFTDSLRSASNIEGWSIVGQNVTWMHPDNMAVSYDSLQVFSGNGSIRVSRKDAGETEGFGYGVLSDYIKVIPGNYQLNLRINLKDVVNPKSRLGVRLYDAVDIRLIYYDKNRIKIDPDFDAPYYKTLIDNGFKGTSLANFTEIDSSGWMQIIGKSLEFPFPDGDLQDDAKFVRVFIGLKANGTMWIDDVSLTYTRWNFTMLERIRPYFDSTLVKSKLIIPQPRKVEILESLIYYRSYYKDEFPLILVDEKSDPLVQQGALLLEKKIRHLLIKHTDLTEDDIPSLIRNSISEMESERNLIFSLGDTRLSDQYADDLPMQEIKISSKAYFIHTIPEKSNIIFLKGNQATGDYFAAQVAVQLFDEKKLIFHNVNVLDYPAKEDYALLLLHYSDLAYEFISTAHQTRFCEIYLPGLEEKTRTIKFTPGQSRNLTRWIYYPWSWDDQNADRCQQIIENLQQVNGRSPVLEGIAFINTDLFGEVSIDSMMQDKVLPKRKHSEEFVQRLDHLKEMIKSRDLQLEIMPEADNNDRLIEAMNHPYSLVRLMDFEEHPVIWSANRFRTWRLDDADLMFFTKYFEEPDVFLDLSLYPKSEKMAYFGNDSVWPYKLQTACLFEPYSNEILPGIYSKVDKILLGFELVSSYDRIRLQTASDYFWNPADYDPDLSLYRAMVSEYGEQLAQDLLYFNDLYFKLKSELIQAKKFKNFNKHQRKIITNLRNIDIILERIRTGTEKMDHPDVLMDTERLLDVLKEEIYSTYPVLSPEQKLSTID